MVFGNIGSLETPIKHFTIIFINDTQLPNRFEESSKICPYFSTVKSVLIEDLMSALIFYIKSICCFKFLVKMVSILSRIRIQISFK